MTEDYLRRLLPQKWAIDVRKVEQKTNANIINVKGINLEMWGFVLPRL
jgi:hypothetical protein